MNITKQSRQFPHSHVSIVATSIIAADGFKLAVESPVEPTVTNILWLFIVSDRVINIFFSEEMTQLLTKKYH